MKEALKATDSTLTLLLFFILEVRCMYMSVSILNQDNLHRFCSEANYPKTANEEDTSIPYIQIK